MRRLFAATAVTLLASAVFLVVVSAGAGPVSIPLKAKWSGITYDVAECQADPLMLTVVNIGNGVSSAGGKAHFTAVYCIPVPPAEDPATGWSITTTANGDTIHTRVRSLILLSDDEWAIDEEIVGGTGKFENATGYLYTEGTFKAPVSEYPGVPPLFMPPGGWEGTSEGEIMY